MRINGLIDQPEVIEKILTHLGLCPTHTLGPRNRPQPSPTAPLRREGLPPGPPRSIALSMSGRRPCHADQNPNQVLP